MNRRIIVPLSGKCYTYGTELLINGDFETRYTYGTELLINGDFETLVAPFMRRVELVTEVLTFWERLTLWLVGVLASFKATVKNAAIAVRGWTVKQWNKFIFMVKKAWENIRSRYG